MSNVIYLDYNYLDQSWPNLLENKLVSGEISLISLLMVVNYLWPIKDSLKTPQSPKGEKTLEVALLQALK